MTLYFAFGSNLSKGQMRERCPDNMEKCNAYLGGYRLDFTFWAKRRNGGVADVVRSEQGSRVWGALYDLNDEDFAKLDVFESVPTVYRREELLVVDSGGGELRAQVYQVVEQSGPYEPSAEYMGVILQGAQEWKLPPDYISMLKGIATASCSKKPS